jgi:hypothetical protein
MSVVNLVAVFAENKLGQMARVTKVVADAGANIRWVTIATSETFGVIKFLVDRPGPTLQRLREQGFTASLVEVLAIEVEDRPGGLHRVADILAQNQVNVQNSSGFVAGGKAVLLVEVDDLAHARAVLEGQGLRLLTQEEVLTL